MKSCALHSNRNKTPESNVSLNFAALISENVVEIEVNIVLFTSK